jgi:hypothetical protein
MRGLRFLRRTNLLQVNTAWTALPKRLTAVYASAPYRTFPYPALTVITANLLLPTDGGLVFNSYNINSYRVNFYNISSSITRIVCRLSAVVSILVFLGSLLL